MRPNATVTLVIPEPSALQSADDYYVGDYNTPLVINLTADGILANDGVGRAGADVDVVQVVADVNPAFGNLTSLDLREGVFVFTPTRGFRGNATFRYSELAWGRPGA